jgi:hypothetical protein
LIITTAALKSRLRQKLTQAAAPIARSAMPTSNWKGLGHHGLLTRLARRLGQRTRRALAH